MSITPPKLLVKGIDGVSSLRKHLAIFHAEMHSLDVLLELEDIGYEHKTSLRDRIIEVMGILLEMKGLVKALEIVPDIQIGDKVIYENKEYRVLGFAASEDAKGRKLIEIAWSDYVLSPTGYLAVPIDDLKRL